MPKGQDENVSVAGGARPRWFDRRYPMTYALVVKKHRIQWIGERERILGLANVIVNLRNAAFDVVAFHQYDTNPVDTVPVHALGRRPSGFRVARFNTELVHLGVPR